MQGTRLPTSLNERMYKNSYVTIRTGDDAPGAMTIDAPATDQVLGCSLLLFWEWTRVQNSTTLLTTIFTTLLLFPPLPRRADI